MFTVEYILIEIFLKCIKGGICKEVMLSVALIKEINQRDFSGAVRLIFDQLVLPMQLPVDPVQY